MPKPLLWLALVALLALWPAALPALAADDVPPEGTRSHDWRAPGFVSVVGGRLFDPDCVPLQSAGSNVPNLAYGGDLPANLEWMRQHHLRWLRVFATGHGTQGERAPRDTAAAVAALRRLVSGVEAFNAGHAAAERIYVMVVLTDYYPPGVPGDRHAYDHPTFRAVPVLPAPWYRPGVRQFDFRQEHGLGLLTGMPNYEVYYLPWVRQLVSSLSGSPALLGWQLGNELKARGSTPNGISSSLAYDWYLAFTRDVVDAIRSEDGNHLILMGPQYIAELVDWPYRADDVGPPTTGLLPEYHRLVQQALAACDRYCWNIWGATNYDFELYGIDDAGEFARYGVATLLTEFGFTHGTPAQMERRFGGDRAAALRSGIDRPWVAADGSSRPARWGAADVVSQAPVVGLAPWASPAPGPTAGFDTDDERGLTGPPGRPLPDEAALWAAWADVGAQLEAANRTAGVSATCQAYVSQPAP